MHPNLALCQARIKRVEAEMEGLRFRAVMLRLAPKPAASRQDVLKYFVQSVQVRTNVNVHFSGPWGLAPLVYPWQPYRELFSAALSRVYMDRGLGVGSASFGPRPTKISERAPSFPWSHADSALSGTARWKLGPEFQFQMPTGTQCAML